MPLSDIIHRIIHLAAIALPALITILNPVTAAAMLSSITDGMGAVEKRQVATKACKTSFWVLVVFTIGGAFIFSLFDITIGAFQIAGGIILFDVGMDLRSDDHGATKQNGVSIREDYSIVPLAIPLISGPGAITTVLILAGEVQHVWEIAVLLVCIFISILTVYVALRYSTSLFKWLGVGGLRILNRVMGLIIAVIAVQFVINGLQSLLPTIIPIIKQYWM